MAPVCGQPREPSLWVYYDPLRPVRRGIEVLDLGDVLVKLVGLGAFAFIGDLPKAGRA